ncbi:hypothetical protein [Rhodoflexus sp.]
MHTKIERWVMLVGIVVLLMSSRTPTTYCCTLQEFLNGSVISLAASKASHQLAQAIAMPEGCAEEVTANAPITSENPLPKTLASDAFRLLQHLQVALGQVSTDPLQTRQPFRALFLIYCNWRL